MQQCTYQCGETTNYRNRYAATVSFWEKLTSCLRKVYTMSCMFGLLLKDPLHQEMKEHGEPAGMSREWGLFNMSTFILQVKESMNDPPLLEVIK